MHKLAAALVVDGDNVEMNDGFVPLPVRFPYYFSIPCGNSLAIFVVDLRTKECRRSHVLIAREAFVLVDMAADPSLVQFIGRLIDHRLPVDCK